VLTACSTPWAVPASACSAFTPYAFQMTGEHGAGAVDIELRFTRPAKMRASIAAASTVVGMVLFVVVVLPPNRRLMFGQLLAVSMSVNLTVQLVVWLVRQGRGHATPLVRLAGDVLATRRGSFRASDIQRPTVRRSTVLLRQHGADRPYHLPLPRSRIMPFSAAERAKAEQVLRWWDEAGAARRQATRRSTHTAGTPVVAQP